MKRLLSIRERLLRIHLAVAFAAVMVFFMAGSVLDWRQTQQVLIDNFTDNMHAAAEGAEAYLQTRDMHGLDVHLRDFHGLPGMMALCVYGEDNQPVAVWQAENATQGCPQFVLHEGIDRHWLGASTAIPLVHNKAYLGMLYAQSRLTVWPTIFLRDGVALLALLSMAYCACRLSSRYGADAITKSLNALKSQIDCLKNDDYTVCALLPPMTTVETVGLARSITNFRAHLATEMLPRKELKQLRHWYEHLLSGLLRSLRQQMDADSPLIDCLDDYEQLLRIEYGATPAEPIVFDIAKLLRTSVQRAREKFPEHSQVVLSVSLESSMQHEWLGQPKMLAMLLQHLLLIALGRTRQGAVCLRLGIGQDDVVRTQRLTIKLEDSGPPLQRWQLIHWLSGSRESVLATEMVQDISWLMTGQLLRYLGGTATAETDPQGGLIFSGSLPITQPQQHLASVILPMPMATSLRAAGERPLLLIVEEAVEKQRMLVELFESLGCRVFLVGDHAQAMVWAPVLPFGALVLNASLPDARSLVVKRLHHLAQENLMPHIPIWAMVGALTGNEEKHWRDAGVSTLLIQPLKPALLELLCTALPLPDADFYRAYDAHLQGDFPATIVTRLPELNREIGNQLRLLHRMLLTLPQQDVSRITNICQQAHAVKSASLSLGYFRLAALMAEIEHALAHKAFDDLPQHWKFIADMLDPTIFEQQERAIA